MWRNWTKMALMAGAILLGLGVAVLTSVAIYLSTNHGQRFVEARLSQTIPGSMTFKAMRLSLWRGQAEFKNLVLKGPSREAIAGFDRLFVDLAWTRSLGGDLTIQTLSLEKPWVKIRKTEEQGINLLEAVAAPRIPEQPEKDTQRQAMPFNLVVRSLDIFGGRAVYEHPSAKLVASVEDIRLTAEGNLGKKAGNLALRVGKGSLQQGDTKRECREVTIQGKLEENRIAPLQIKMAMGTSRLNISGTVEDVFGKPHYNVSAHLAATLSDLQEPLQIPSRLAGSADAELTLRGTAQEPEMALRLDCRDALAGPYLADRLTLDCTLKDRQFVLKGLWDNDAAGKIQVNGDADLTGAFPKGLLGDETRWEAMAYKLSVAAENVEPSGFFSGAAKVTGVVDATLAVEGTGVSPESLSAKSVLKAVVRNVSSQTQRRAVDWQVEVEGNLHQNTVSVQRLAVEGASFKVGATGQCDLSTERIAGHLRLESPDITPALSSLGLTEASGTVVLEADVSGLLKMPQARLVFDGQKMRFQDYVFGDLHVDGTLDETGTLRLAEVSVKNQGSVVEGHGHVGIYEKPPLLDPALPVNLSLAIRNVQLSDFVKNSLARGALDGHVHVTGSIKAPEAKAHVRGKAVAVQALQLGDLDAKLALAKGTLHIHQLDLQNKNSAVRVTGAVGLFHEPGFQAVGDPAFHLNIEEGRIALNNFHERARGNLAIAANLKGSLSKPMGTLRLEGTNLDFGVQKLDGLKLLVTLDGERLWVKPFQLVVAPGETVEGQGWVSLDRRFDMTLVSPGVSLEHIDLLDKKAAAKGTMRCNISLAGGWQDPQVHGEISLEGLQMWGQSMENMTVEVNMENQLARILARHHFNLEGTYDLTKRDFTVSLQLEDTDLEPYFRLAGQADFGGLATGKVEASGNLGAMDDLRASLDMRKLALSWQGKGLVHTENLKASVKDQYLSLWPVMLAVGTDGHLRLHGTARRNGPVAMEAQGEIPLAVLAPFIEPLPDLEGRLVLSAQVDGSQDRPQISAEVTMRQVGFTVPGLLQRLEALEGRVRIDSREIAIDHLGGKLDGGSFVLTGHVGTEAFRPTTIHAQIKADAVPVRLPDTLDLLLNTELNIEGTKEQATVQGEVAVLEGTYYKDVRLSFLPEAAGRRREETPPPEISHPLFRNTELDVSIKRRDPLIVDNNLAHLEINPDLRIVGKLDNPIIRGRATVESGTIQYRKKTFEVKKGVVDFSNPYKTEPHIDIEAETTVRHWTIVLALAGTPDALSFKLTSAPPEEDGDILSLLVMGRTTGELIAGEGGAGKSSAQMLAEAMAGALSDDIKKATGLDTLEVQVGTENGQDAVRVTVGKDLSRRMSVKYVTESKEGNIVERAVAEYKFLEHILFSGSQDTEGVFGGEVKYRLEFR